MQNAEGRVQGANGLRMEEGGEFRGPKLEIRNKAEDRNPKSEVRKLLPGATS
jgi:hypothetical protein